MNNRPLISPKSWIGMMCGSVSLDTNADSLRNRALNSSSSARFAGNRLSATTR